MNEFTFADLFCGLGGFRIALEENGGKCVFSSDNNLDVCKIYEENFHVNPFSDIFEIGENDVPTHDILCAGFPCQPFSIAGKRKGFLDARGTLFFEVVRIAKKLQPKVIFLENVAGIVSHDNGKTIQVILDSLNEIGYIPYTNVMNAKDYGIPQNRNRWYCVAVRKDLNKGIFSFPDKSELMYSVNDVVTKGNIKGYESTNRAIENIKKHLEMFENTDRYKNSDKENIILANEIRASKCNFRNDGISPCLTAKMGTGGNNIPVVVKYSRKLTEKECLSLMGFPKSYKIKEHCMSSYKQIGNSVVVPVISKICENIVRYLGDELNG